jgi:hypothetical protein
MDSSRIVIYELTFTTFLFCWVLWPFTAIDMGGIEHCEHFWTDDEPVGISSWISLASVKAFSSFVL